MTDKSNGYFEAFVNSRATTVGVTEKALMTQVVPLVQRVVPRSQVRWAGSQRKGTAVMGSDLDMCVESTDPVTEALRRDLRAALEAGLGRPVHVRAHVVRVGATSGLPKLDIAFANAAFGSRPLPDLSEFKDQRGRQAAARALKLWTRGGGLPRIGGWAWEALVVHLDAPRGRGGLDLFQRIVGWLESTATPAALDGVLRHANQGRWNPVWSSGVPGTLEALRNHAKALRRRSPPPEGWKSPDDVGRWLCP
jgi:hypothetical protein